jgi:hypothetical protein
MIWEYGQALAAIWGPKCIFARGIIGLIRPQGRLIAAFQQHNGSMHPNLKEEK